MIVSDDFCWRNLKKETIAEKQMRIASSLLRLLQTFVLVHERCFHETLEQWMRLDGARTQLRMELTRDKPGVIGQLDDFDEHIVRRYTAKDHSVLFEELPVMIVHFIAMAMALVDDFLSIRFRRFRIALENAWIRTESHRPAFCLNRFLFEHQVDHVLRRVGKLRGRRTPVQRAPAQAVPARPGPFVPGRS